MIWDQVKDCTVPILTVAGDTRGTGFFISSQGHLLTCAHVVELAGGSDNIRVKEAPTQLVYLGDRSNDDFAILRVLDYRGISVPLSLSFLPLNRFLTIGYGRPDFPHGASIDGTITDVNPQADFGNRQMIRLRIKANSQQIQPGFSGSPLFDTESESVVGIIAAYDNVDGALAIPLTTVQERWPSLESFLKSSPILVSEKSIDKTKRVFISYRSEDPDLSLAQRFYETLRSAGHWTFMAGESLRLGDDWPERIRSEIEECDYFVLLLSPKSAESDMVTEEVRLARSLRDERADQRPRILPVRVRFPFSAPINYDLGGYLNRIHQRGWQSDADTNRVLGEILDLISSGEPSKPLISLDPSSSRCERQEFDQPPLPVAEPELPQGQVDLGSPYYVERPPIEYTAYEAIVRPGALVRIKAPRQMGKTSLMARTLSYARDREIAEAHHSGVRRGQDGYLTVSLSFQLADAPVFSDLDKLLEWFCSTITWKLEMPDKLPQFWKLNGSKIRCTAYFQEYLLLEAEKRGLGLVVALDEVDLVFQYINVAADFFGMLRTWNEEAKNETLWRRLGLIIVHSTEVYIPLKINESPFNVGLGIELPEFDSSQVADLASRHGLNWNNELVADLMDLVGGHPFLLRMALYYISRQETTLSHLLQTAHTDSGLYGDHLRRHLWNLEQHSELAEALKEVVSTVAPVNLESQSAFKLESMGLVNRQRDEVTPRCKLYRLYFNARLRAKK